VDDHVDELIPAHVLGALDAEESARVQRHTATCPGCMAQLRDAEQATSLLALSAPQVPAPAALRDRLMAAVESEPQTAAEPAVVAAGAPPQRERRQTLGWWPRFARIAAPVLAVAVIALVAWNVSLRNSLTNTQDTIYGSATSAALPHVGTVFIDSDGQATLEANASAAPSGKTYQAWVIPPGGKPISAGIFSGGRTSVQLAAAAHPGDTVAVTVEPAGGSAQPTSHPIAASRVT
jgi:anti-sigma-K factor RskA